MLCCLRSGAFFIGIFNTEQVCTTVAAAYSMLKRAVRALPICKSPVGEGANRVTTFFFCVLALFTLFANIGVLCTSGPANKTSTSFYFIVVMFLLNHKLLEMERAKGFEPSAPTLARLCSTPELRPLI